MLARVADALYWMGRYIERADNISRFVEVNWNLTLDYPDAGSQQWDPLISVTQDNEQFAERYGAATQKNVLMFLIFDADNPNSIFSSLRSARSNARKVREIIPPEMWEHLNICYHRVDDSVPQPGAACKNPFELCRRVRLGSMLLGGIANDTMIHDEAWHFFNLGRLLERADKTSRMLDVKYFILLPSAEDVGTSCDNLQWAALLQSDSALEMYRRRYGRITLAHVMEFLLLDRLFPRSVLRCLMSADESLGALSGTADGNIRNNAEPCLRQLCEELSFTSIDHIFQQGPHEFINGLQARMNAVGEAIFETFFREPQVPATAIVEQ
ncbi:MAG: alpha-E domain-containing protein [Phycisphaerae bacterium]|nr:alpha-E domain-containing protein [Phycisphaerae bacterium]